MSDCVSNVPCVPVVRYPGLTVHLTGGDGNAFAVMGAVAAGLRWYGVDQAEINEFYDEAKAGDYNALLRTCMAWVNVD